MNSLTDIVKFQTPFHSYENSKEYRALTNDLVILSGYQLFTFIMNYNSLFDLYIQKFDDYEYIQINSKLSKFNNTIKLLEANKTYYLNFTVDHLIKLDNKFLDAEIMFIDKKGQHYFLNKTNKVIKNLRGDNIKVISNQIALIYFYKRIPDFCNLETIIFNKTQTGRNMRFNIIMPRFYQATTIYIIKDFGFEGYYPILDEKS